jgi:hypothetical protein
MKLLAHTAVGSMFLIAFLTAMLAAGGSGAEAPIPATSAGAVAHSALADSLAALIRHAIPPVTDKKEDWGATKEISTGVRVDGKPFHWHAHRRKKSVDHGVWKHYIVRLVEPEKHLVVKLTRLEALPGGKFAFTLHIETPIDVWARAKVYQYGVHLIAVEVEADARLQLDVSGEVGVRFGAEDGAATVAVEPVATDARLSFDYLNIHRVSNAHGPLVDELGGGVRRMIEDELAGPKLTARLNQAIDKKRDRLTFSSADLLRSSWWPLGQREAGETPAP